LLARSQLMQHISISNSVTGKVVVRVRVISDYQTRLSDPTVTEQDDLEVLLRGVP
jgi:hypothetical protein